MLATSKSNILINVDQDYILYWSAWNDLTYGKTDAEISALTGIPEADVPKYTAAFGFLSDVYKILHGLQAGGAAYDYSSKIAAF